MNRDDLTRANPAERDTCLAFVDATYRWERFAALALKKRASWIAIPHEMGGDIVEAEAARIAEAARPERGLWFVEEFGGTARSVYDVPAVASAVRGARFTLGIADVAIVPRSLRWLVIGCEADFGVILGNLEDVQRLAGFDPQEAHERFQAYVATWNRVPAPISAVAAAPWHEYERLPEGDELVVRWCEPK